MLDQFKYQKWMSLLWMWMLLTYYIECAPFRFDFLQANLGD